MVSFCENMFGHLAEVHGYMDKTRVFWSVGRVDE